MEYWNGTSMSDGKWLKLKAKRVWVSNALPTRRRPGSVREHHGLCVDHSSDSANAACSAAVGAGKWWSTLNPENMLQSAGFGPAVLPAQDRKP
jgi:hypothetical protein